MFLMLFEPVKAHRW